MKRSRVYDEEAHSGALRGAGFGKSRPGLAGLGRGATNHALTRNCCQKGHLTKFV
jgi:hypothetical protein